MEMRLLRKPEGYIATYTADNVGGLFVPACLGFVACAELYAVYGFMTDQWDAWPIAAPPVMATLLICRSILFPLRISLTKEGMYLDYLLRTELLPLESLKIIYHPISRMGRIESSRGTRPILALYDFEIFADPVRRSGIEVISE